LRASRSFTARHDGWKAQTRSAARERLRGDRLALAGIRPLWQIAPNERLTKVEEKMRSPAFQRSADPSHRTIAEIEKALEPIDRLATAQDLECYLGELTRALGFDFFSYGYLNPAQVSARVDSMELIITSYPRQWHTHYEKNRYYETDPTILGSCQSRQPFFWGDQPFLKQLSKSVQGVFNEARDFGICSGYTIPIHGPNECGLFSVSSAGRFESFRAAARESQLLLQLIGSRVHAFAADRIVLRPEAAPVSLTDHERVCLKWTMCGKTSWEIAQIVNRSRPTIDFHLQKATRKLDASNKFHAAFKAFQAGLL
jgi:DNA-binding CsgD family transcriptional regulator